VLDAPPSRYGACWWDLGVGRLVGSGPASPKLHGRAAVASTTWPLVRRGAEGRRCLAHAPASGLVVDRDRLASGHSHPQVGQPVHSSRLVGEWRGEAEASTYSRILIFLARRMPRRDGVSF
jgi:hypothetical protein